MIAEPVPLNTFSSFTDGISHAVASQDEAGRETGSMERIISELLQAFEARKLIRRQLIQALALG
jgi:antirestriction protein ArdC